ncbi:Na(+)/citrate cotransporter-like isoform X4 [Rhinoraja longicauda]
MLWFLRVLREFRDPFALTLTLPVLVLLPLPLVLRSKVCKQYMKDTNMLFLGGLMVAVAVESCNLHKRIALRALLLVGVRPALLMLGFMCVTAFLSMWISNTATTAMMVPIAQAVLQQLNTTTTNPGDPEPGHPEPRDPEPGHGQTAGDLELETKDATDQAPIPLEVQIRNTEVDRERRASSVPYSDELREQRQMQKMLSLSICYSASIGGTATLTGTGPNLVLKGQFNQIFPDNGDVINFASWFGFSFPNMLIMLTCCWLWLHLLFLGVNFARLRSCHRESSPREQAAYGIIQGEYIKLGLMSFAEKLVLGLFVLLVILWFTREPGFVPGWGSLFNKKGKKYISDATVVMLITFLMFIMPSNRPHFRGWPWHRTVEVEPGYVSEERKGGHSVRLLDWKVVQRKLPWNVVLLLGGGFALAKGCQVSGLSLWLGKQMLPLKNLPQWSIAVLLCMLIASFTECTSNVATATLFLPILANMAVLIRMNPLYILIPSTLSTSFAFMLPVATPPNAIVFSYGQLRVTDMVKAGIVLNVISVVSVTVAINTWGRAMFDLDSFPAWANIPLLTGDTTH